MGTKRSRGAPPSQAVDLLRIVGIDPALAERLAQAGIQTCARLAELSPDALADLLAADGSVSAARIVAEDWIGQAQELAAVGETLLAERRRYATFKVELLLDDEQHVRRTQVIHIQSGNEATWAGWDERGLVEFVSQRADLRSPAPGAAPVDPGGGVRLSDLAPLIAPNGRPRHLVAAAQPFGVTLTIDLTEIAGGETPLDYAATVYAKRLGDGARQLVGETIGCLAGPERATVQMQSNGLPPGAYRLEATVALKRTHPDLRAQLEGGLLQVY